MGEADLRDAIELVDNGTVLIGVVEDFEGSVRMWADRLSVRG